MPVMNNLVVRAKRFFPKGGFTRSVTVLAGGTALGQAVVVLSSPVLTRFYTPGEFGDLTVYISILSILTVVASLRYEATIPLPEEPQQAADLLGLSLLLVLITSVLTGGIVWAFADPIVNLMHTPQIKPFLWLLPLSLLGAGGYQALNSWAVRKKAFSQVAQTKLNQSIGQVVTQTGLGWLQFGTFGLLVGDVVGRIAGSGKLVRMAWQQEKSYVRQISVFGMIKMAKRYKRFPLLSCGSVLLNTLGTQMTPLLLSVLYGPTTVGWYMLANRVLGLPLSLIGNSVSQVYLAEAVKLSRENRQQLRVLFWRTVRNLFWLGLPLVGVIALVASKLFGFVFGDSWGESGVFMQWLAPMFLLQFVSIPLGSNLVVMERNDLHLIREIIRILLVVSAMFFAKELTSEPATAILIFSIAGSLGYVMHILYSWLAMKENKNHNVMGAGL